MEDNNILIQLTKDKLAAFAKKAVPMCFSITAEYDDLGKQPYKVAKALVGPAEFISKINVAINQLKPNRIKIVIYKGETENENKIEDTTILQLPENGSDKGSLPASNDILSQISQMLSRQNSLAGIVEEKTTQLSDLQFKYERDLGAIAHKIELDRKDEQIREMKSELEDLKKEYSDAMESLEKFQKVYDDEKQMENWGNKLGGILKGVVAVVPGVVKWAESKPMLAGLPQAILSGGEAPEDQGSQPDGQPVDYNSPAFQKIQKVLQFVQGLTDDEANMFMSLVDKIEIDKSTLLTLIGLLN